MKRKPTWRHPENSAGYFTLVELLVVIAIIAVLAALLLPALNRARVKAKVSHCMMNMKSQGQGVMLYAGDNNEQLPTPKAPNAGDDLPFGSSFWMWTLHESYRCGQKLFVCPHNPHNDASDNTANWVLGMGTKSANALEAGGGMNNHAKNFYSMNGRLLRRGCRYGNETRSGSLDGIGGKLSRATAPSRSVMLLETFSPIYVDGTNQITTVVLTRFGSNKNSHRDHYGESSNFGVIDGHVENLRYPNNTNNLFFNPLSGQEAKSAKHWVHSFWYINN